MATVIKASLWFYMSSFGFLTWWQRRRRHKETGSRQSVAVGLTSRKNLGNCQFPGQCEPFVLSFLRISFSLSLKSPSIKFIIFIYIIIAQKHHMFTLISSQYAGKLSLWTKLNGLASCVSYRDSEVECRKYQSGGRKFDSFFFHLLVCVCHSLNNIFLILPGLKLTIFTHIIIAHEHHM